MNIIRSNRKTLAIEIKNGELIIRSPIKTSEKEILNFVKSHQKWIDRHLTQSRESLRKARNAGLLSIEDINKLANTAIEIIPKHVRYYAQKIGVNYGKITIRNQRTKWGSCSGKGNLNFNCLLMLAPTEVLDSVIVHELCHLKEMNHSKDFYNEVLKVFPEYHRWNDWLKKNGAELMARMTG